MNKILCTFPGKLGDILWALPTVRAISQQAGEPVDICIGGKYLPLLELVFPQPYIDRAWGVLDWEEGEHAAWVPPVPSGYEKVYHLRYPGWPRAPLALETFCTARNLGAPIELEWRMNVPWITLPAPMTKDEARQKGVYWVPPAPRSGIYLGWTDEWFELKLGVSLLLQVGLDLDHCEMLQPAGSRWTVEGNAAAAAEDDIKAAGWLDTARAIASSKLYVGCLSAQWVLANALGIPCVVVEPNPARHNPIFWWDGPLEQDCKPRNRMVMGLDGRPTFDARAVVQTVKEELERVR